jgi:hypothetical protein
MDVTKISDVIYGNHVKRYSHSMTVYLEYGRLDQVIEWCKKLSRQWSWELEEFSSSSVPGKYKFYFGRKRDLTAFILRWG